MRKRLLVTALLLSVLTARAASSGKTGFAFLRFSPYPRSAGMAEATSGMVGDSLVLYSNPAGLAHLSGRELSGQYVLHFQDVTYQNMSFIVPYRRGGLGVSAGVLNVADIPRTRFDASVADRFVESGEAEAGDKYAAVSWGRRQTENLALGMSLKGVQETLDDQSASAVVADLGGIYRFSRRWRGALVVQNAGTAGKFLSESVPPPTRVRLGGHWTPEKWMQWAGEGVFTADGEPEALVGAEFNWDQTGFARVGYRYAFRNSDLGVAAGLALGAGLHAGVFRVDYAFLPVGDLGESHRFSAGWRF